jgi:hypothetical protein
MTLILVLVASAICVAQSDQPTLGDLAKKQRHDKKVVKVLTNDDVATVKPDTSVQSAKAEPPTATAASPSAAAVKAPDKVTNAKTASVSKDPPEIAELKQKLTSYKQEQQGWKSSAKTYEDKLATETDDFRRQMYADALEGDKHNVELFQNKIDQTQDDLTKVEKASTQGH